MALQDIILPLRSAELWLTRAEAAAFLEEATTTGEMRRALGLFQEGNHMRSQKTRKRIPMEKVQQVVPVTDLRLHHLQVFDLLKNGPVVLAQRSRPAAVLVSVDQWDRTAEIIEDLSDTVDALRMELAIAKGEVEMMSQEELHEWLTEDEQVPA